MQRSSRSRARRGTAVLTVALACLGGMILGATVAATPAYADSFGPYPAKVAIDGRGSMDVNDRVKTDAYRAGDPVYLRCQDIGQPVNGNSVWGYTTKGYWIPDTYIKTGVDGFLGGISRCRDIGIHSKNFFGDHGPYPAKVAIDGRATMNVDHRVQTDAYLAGDDVYLQCQDSGPAVNGSPVWDFTAEGFWVPDTYVRTGVDGFLPGVPRCASIGINGHPVSGGGQNFLVKTTLNGYHGKSLGSAKVVDKYQGGSYVGVVCQAYGEANYGGSRVWDKTTDGLWIPDYYVKTGATDIILSRCDGDGPSDAASGQRFLVKTTLNGYHGKSLGSTSVVDKYPAGSYVSIVCQAYGEHSYGGSYIWDRTSDGLWVADYYIKTGSDDIILRRCDDDGPVGGGPSEPAPTPPGAGSVPVGEIRSKIVKAAQGAMGTTEWGDNCNPYGRYGVVCGAPWCSMFASWTWRMAGVDVHYPYSGDFYHWGKRRGLLRGFGQIRPGDVVLYGSGPSASQHIGVVEQVLSDGRIVTIEGNYGNTVKRVGPFDPDHPQPQHTYSNIFAVVAPVADPPPAPKARHLYTFDLPVTHAADVIRLPIKAGWSTVSAELHRCFNCSFPIGGAPRGYPANGQRIPLRICVLGVCKSAPVKAYTESSGYRFETEPGHFDGVGSTVRFQFYSDSSGFLRLKVSGYVVKPEVPDFFNKAGAHTAWSTFAARLGDSLQKRGCSYDGCS